MPNFQNTGMGTDDTGSRLSRVLDLLSRNSTSTTREVSNILDRSNPTTLRRLRELEEMGLVTSTKPGQGYRWSLNTYPLDQGTKTTKVPPEDYSQLLTGGINLVVDRLTTSKETIEQYPEIKSWLEDRNVDDSYPQLEYAYRVAVYRRFLQATLYGLHQTEYPELEELKETTDWDSCFKHAFNVVDDSGFEPSAVDTLVENDVATHRMLQALRHPLLHDSQPANTLATVYEQLTSQDARRDLGQFATPVNIGRFMASWIIEKSNDTVLDPGIGAGQLASQALFEKVNLGAEEPLADILGIDIDEIAITMASTALKLVDGAGSADLRKGDFVSLRPFTYEGDKRVREVYDSVIANPPYSRHQAIDNRLKSDLHSTVSEETGYEFLRRTPLYAYFIAHAAQFVKEGGRLAFIIPSKFMDTEFGRQVKEYLLNEFHIYGVIQLSDNIPVFDGVRTRPSILFLEAGSPTGSHETRFIKLAEWPELDSASDLIECERSLADLEEVEFATTIAQELVSPSERWTHYFDPTEVDELPQLTRFDEIATIKRGIATGKNDYFCLSKDDLEEHPIPEQFRRRILRTARGLDIFNIRDDDWCLWERNGEEVWLLYLYDEDGIIECENLENEQVVDYIREGVYQGVTDGYLVSKRNPWYKVEERNPVPILGKYMNRRGFHFMRNDANLLTLNNVHGIDPKENYSEDQLNALLAYLNSRLFERQLVKLSHDYNGLQKIEISQLKSAPVIDPEELSEDCLSRLSSLFEKLCTARRSGDGDEEILSDIETELEALLDIHDKD